MQPIVRIALLATTAAVVFLNPLYLGRVLYYSLFVLLFGLGLLYWYTTWHVGKKAASVYVKGPLRYRSNATMASSLEEKRVWGALVITDDEVLFLMRSGKTIETGWSAVRSEVICTAPFANQRKKGLLLATEKEGRYVYINATEPVVALLSPPQNE